MKFVERLRSNITAAQTPRLAVALNVFMAVYALAVIVDGIDCLLPFAPDFASWNLTEFLVSYADGYVRRGLLGELLYRFTCSTGISPYVIIYPLCVISFLAVLVLFGRALHRFGLWWWIIPTSVCFGVVANSFIRKDFLIILLAIASFMIYNRRSISPALRLLLIFIIAMLCMNLHESSFFIYITLMMWMIVRDDTLRVARVWKWLFVGGIIMGMAILSVLTGNPSTPEAITEAWHSAMPADIPDHGLLTIDSIGWSITYALKYNDSVLLFPLTNTPIKAVVKALLFIYIIYFGLLIIRRYPYIASTSGVSRFPIASSTYSALLLFLMVSLSPLFLGLSCDYGRLLMYVCIIAMMFVATFPADRIAHALKPIEPIAARIDKWLYGHIPANIYILAIILILYQAPYARFSDYLLGPIYLIFNTFIP